MIDKVDTSDATYRAEAMSARSFVVIRLTENDWRVNATDSLQTVGHIAQLGEATYEVLWLTAPHDTRTFSTLKRAIAALAFTADHFVP